MKNDIKTAAIAVQDQIIAWRRELHACPELRMDTPVTEEKICRILSEIGVKDIRSGIGGHGVAAVIYGTKPGKCLGIRADCDGLPIPEETGLPFAAVNGNMHACGHDAHCAMALGAAKLIFDNRHRLQGSVKFIFQPYEEGDGGAKAMIADGVLENPHVDAIIALHIGNIMGMHYNSGDIVATHTPITANIYAFKATFIGRGAHVCMPDEGINPVYMACDAIQGLRNLLNDTLQEERIILSVPKIQGGVRNNIVPGTCTIEGSLRSFNSSLHTSLKNKVTEICEMAAKTMGGSVKLEVTIDLMATQNNRDLYDHLINTAESLFGKNSVKILDPKPMSGDDFARYASIIPGLFFYLCAKPDGRDYPHHHPKFDIDERQLYMGSALFAEFALTWQQ